MNEVRRADRVAEGIRNEISSMLQGELTDPRLEGVIVSRIRVSDDLRHARVHIRFFREADESRKKSALAGLGRATGLIRREVTQRLGLRMAPELAFEYDREQDAETRIESILHEIRTEKV